MLIDALYGKARKTDRQEGKKEGSAVHDTSGTLVSLCTAFRVRRVTVRVFVCAVHSCDSRVLLCVAHLFFVDWEH